MKKKIRERNVWIFESYLSEREREKKFSIEWLILMAYQPIKNYFMPRG